MEDDELANVNMEGFITFLTWNCQQKREFACLTIAETYNADNEVMVQTDVVLLQECGDEPASARHGNATHYSNTVHPPPNLGQGDQVPVLEFKPPVLNGDLARSFIAVPRFIDDKKGRNNCSLVCSVQEDLGQWQEVGWHSNEAADSGPIETTNGRFTLYLRVVKDGQKYLFMNVHYASGNKKDAKAQLYVDLIYAEAAWLSDENIPTILCGDLNLEPLDINDVLSRFDTREIIALVSGYAHSGTRLLDHAIGFGCNIWRREFQPEGKRHILQKAERRTRGVKYTQVQGNSDHQRAYFAARKYNVNSV